MTQFITTIFNRQIDITKWLHIIIYDIYIKNKNRKKACCKNMIQYSTNITKI